MCLPRHSPLKLQLTRQQDEGSHFSQYKIAQDFHSMFAKSPEEKKEKYSTSAKTANPKSLFC